MEYDTSLKKHVGEFGWYQALLVFLLSLVQIQMGYFTMSYVFIMATPVHWCHVPELDHLNLSMAEVKAFSVPLDQSAEVQPSFHSCLMYNRSYVNTTTKLVRDVVAANTSSGNSSAADAEIIGCRSGWTYDKSIYESSLVTEWGLVCSRKWITGTTQSCYAFGFLVGAIMIGYVSDLFGRRKTLALTLVSLVGLAFAHVYTTHYILYSVIRFFTALMSIGALQAAFCLSMELVGPDWRVFAGNVFMFAWAFGYILIGGVAYFVRDHVTLSLGFAGSFAFYVLLPIIVPESPRWLIVKGRKDEGYAVMRKIAKLNGRRIPKELDVTVEVKKKRTNIIDLFRTPNLRKITLILWFVWFANSFVYYAISWNTSGLGGNVYLNFMLSAAVELPAYMYNTWVLGRFGRRLPIMQAMVTTGICILCVIPINPANHVPIVAITMVGKFFIAASFAMIWVYTPELYPVLLRTLGLGFNSAGARTASIVAAQVPLIGDVNRISMLFVFGLVSLMAGLSVLLVPETKGIPLPETIADSETLGKNFSIRDGLCRWKRKQEIPESKNTLNPEAGNNQQDEVNGLMKNLCKEETVM